MRIEAKMVAQAVSLLCCRLAVGGAPICNRLTIRLAPRDSKTNFQSCLRRAITQLSIIHKSLNTKGSRARSCQIVSDRRGRGKARLQRYDGL